MPNLTGLFGDQGFPDTRKPEADLYGKLGILSPTDQATQMQQMDYLRQQQAIQQQQLALQQQGQKIQQAQLGTGYGFPVLTALGGNTPQRQPAFGISQQQQGPDVHSIARMVLAKHGQDPKGLNDAGVELINLGTQQNNGDLLKIGAQMRAYAREQLFKEGKDEAEIDSKNVDMKTKLAEEGRKSAQAGNPGKIEDFRTSNGDIKSIRQRFNSQGGYIGDETMGQGPVKQTNTNIDETGLTNTQFGKQIEEFTALRTNAEQASDNIKRIDALLAQGAGQGWAGRGVTFMNNLRGTLAQMDFSGSTWSASAQAALDSKRKDFVKWAHLTNMKDSDFVDLVSSLAKTYNPTGTITEKDITRAADAVGAGLSDVGSVRQVLQEAKMRMFRSVDTSFKNKAGKVKDMVGADYQDWRGRVGAPFFVSTPEEARKLPPGAKFVTPDGEELSNGK